MDFSVKSSQWSSVFAVPSSIVEEHLKLSSESQLKVLLYILKYSQSNITEKDISNALSYSEEEVKNAIDFWCERGVLSCPEKQEEELPKIEETKITSQKKPILRMQKPDHAYVAKRLSEDKNLSDVLTDAQMLLSKPLSSGDAQNIVMLYDCYGLPCEVIEMLISYCVSEGKANMNSIVKTGIKWADEEIFSVELAEKKITEYSRSSNAFTKVARIFGIKLIGNPTKKQQKFADTWVNEWHFSDEMLLEAYERCVNTKGVYDISYINAILSKWYAKEIKSLDTLKDFESKTRTKKLSKKPKSSVNDPKNTAFDIEYYEQHSSLDD